MKTTTMKTMLITFGLLLATPAWAQEEDDHATKTSGHDPATENRGSLAAQEMGGSAATPIDIDKTFGIGYGQTPGGVTGLEAEYYLTSFMLNAHLALGLFSPDTGDSSSYFAVAVGGFYRWKVYDNVALMLGARLDIGHASYGGGGGAKLPQTYGSGDSATQFNIEGVLRTELYLGMLSIHAEVGPVISIIGENGGVFESDASLGKGFYISIPSQTLLASFGVIIYTN